MKESSLLSAIGQAVEIKASKAEDNALMEVKSGFCKEKLIPKVARALREMAEELSPMQVNLHRALSFDMCTVCGDRDTSRLMNLGGITINFPLTNNSIARASWFLFSDLQRSEVGILVALTPEVEFTVYGDNLFDLSKIYNTEKMPSFNLIGLNGAKETVEASLRPGSRFEKKNLSFCTVKSEFYKITDTEYYEFIKGAWKHAKDTLALIAGPDKINDSEGLKGVL